MVRLQKVSKDVNLFGLVRHEDIVATVEEVFNKFDFGTD
jgi:ribosomal protein L9